MAMFTVIASDGKPIEVTNIPEGISEKKAEKEKYFNSIKKPEHKRDISRAGTDIYVLPCWHLFYDENGYCTKISNTSTVDRMPEEIYEKLVELNK